MKLTKNCKKPFRSLSNSKMRHEVQNGEVEALTSRFEVKGTLVPIFPICLAINNHKSHALCAVRT